MTGKKPGVNNTNIKICSSNFEKKLTNENCFVEWQTELIETEFEIQVGSRWGIRSGGDQVDPVKWHLGLTLWWTSFHEVEALNLDAI